MMIALWIYLAVSILCGLTAVTACLWSHDDEFLVPSFFIMAALWPLVALMLVGSMLAELWGYLRKPKIGGDRV